MKEHQKSKELLLVESGLNLHRKDVLFEFYKISLPKIHTNDKFIYEIICFQLFE